MRTVILFLFLTALGLAAVIAVDRLPPRHWPFAPLNLHQPIGLATSGKLSSLRSSPGRCRAVLDSSAIETAPVGDRMEGGFCGLQDVVAIERSNLRYSGPVRVTCPMAAALYLWERDVVMPAATRHLGARVTRIDHLGTYSCRRVNGGAAGRPSQHAANAIDVAGFRLSDGRRISVFSDWREAETTRASALFCARYAMAVVGCFAASSARTITRRTGITSTSTWGRTASAAEQPLP